jgi:probable F420-dependent oxidoreductase
VKLGICLPHYGRPLEVDRLAAVARWTEDCGLDSVWVTDHVILPHDMAITYRDHMLDALAVLPWLAALTTRVALGTSVIILPYRSPVPVAKHLASVDVLSGGRLIFGAGVGYIEGEFAALGVPMRERGRRTDEALTLIRTLWTEARPTLRTERHVLEGVQFSPLPLQKPRPPIWIGGRSPAAYQRAARLGDGWQASATPPEAFHAGAEAVREAWRVAGRDGEPALSLRAPLLVDGIHRPAVDMSLLRGRWTFHGSVDQVIDTLRQLRDLGCQHVAFDVAFTTYPAVLETIEVLGRTVRPALA